MMDLRTAPDRLRSRAPLIATLALLLAIALPARAEFLGFQLPGTTTYDGWADMTGINYPGYGFFPGAGLWPAPITPNLAGSNGNVGFDKVSGNGFPSGFSVYAPFTSSVFEMETSSPTAFDLETVVFQVDLGPGDGFVFYDAAPTLSYNGGSQDLAPDWEETNEGDYPFTNPTNPAETGTTSAISYQWDLTGLGSITTYRVEWTTHPHAQMYEFQIDASDTFGQIVPEPSGFTALSLSVFGLAAAARRRARAG